MAKGIDTPSSCWKSADCLKSSGIEFVGRYYNTHNQAKNLTKTEAGVLIAAGLTIVAVWENGFPTRADYFTTGQGEQDAAAALKIAGQIGQPELSAIYFTVDYDATEADMPAVTRYFQAIADAFDAADRSYDTGVYGSGAVCKSILTAGLAGWSWLSQSMGWRGSHEFVGYDIRQGMTTRMCGISVDMDDADTAACGGFTSLDQT